MKTLARAQTRDQQTGNIDKTAGSNNKEERIAATDPVRGLEDRRDSIPLVRDNLSQGLQHLNPGMEDPTGTRHQQGPDGADGRKEEKP